MKKIFRCKATDSSGVEACNKARDLILSNCTSCHTFVPIVMQQFDKKGWDGLIARHRVRVPQLGDANLAAIEAYLVANFDAQHPPPEIPEELRKTWLPY